MNLRRTLITKHTILILVIGIVLGVVIWRFMIAPAELSAAAAQTDLAVKQASVAQLRSEVNSAESGDVSDVEANFTQAAAIEEVLRPNASREYREFLLAYMPTLPRTVGIDIIPTTPGAPSEQAGGLSFIDYPYTFDASIARTQAFMQAVYELPLLTTIESFSTTETGAGPESSWSTQVTVRVWWSDLEPLPGYRPIPLNLSALPPATGVSVPDSTAVDGLTGTAGAAADGTVTTVPPETPVTSTTTPVTPGSVSQGSVSSDA